ncbi:MAG TPA: hypothetical protein VJS69_06285 [Candidatus Krumholzibacteria bacterium]|nr:hypothetical protein [Candidatus Krumholzibacteria bacterium]
MTRLVRVVFLLALVLAAARASSAPHVVTYLTSATAYVDAGIDDGLHPGDKVEVVRAGTVIAVLRVTDASSHRAACTIESVTAALAVGDVVRFTAGTVGETPPSAAPAVAAPETGALAPAVSNEGESWARRNGLRGRIGVRYLGLFDQGGFGGNVKEPSADIRVDGDRVGGSAFDLQVDVRARHTVQTVADGREFNDGQARVYRLNTRWRSAGDRYHLTLGRQFSNALASISTFDGAELAYEKPVWGLGAFAGTQPEPVDYGFSTDIAEYGVYARLRTAPGAATRWEMVTAAIGSYQQAHVNREYVAFLGRAVSSRASLEVQQDVDVNRGWKRDAGESAVTFTNTFASARWRASHALDLDAGYDNRRNIRLYRAETQFDDTYRQGVWGGMGVGFAKRYRVGFSTRANTGGSSGSANTYTGLAAANHVTPAQLDFHLRSTYYDNDASDGWLHSGGVASSLGAGLMLELFGGVRSDHSKLPAMNDSDTSWFGADMDLDLGSSIYLNLSGEHNSGDDESYNQVYSGVSWRF